MAGFNVLFTINSKIKVSAKTLTHLMYEYVYKNIPNRKLTD